MNEPIATILRAIARTVRRAAFRHTLMAGLAALTALPSLATTPPPPQVDLSALPALGAEWREENPYRGNPLAARLGGAVYAQSCARCHGKDATEPGPAANLRLVGLYCRRLSDPELAHRCTRDADYYFRTTVLEGKVRLGVEHMPPWAGVLSQEAIWAVRTFVEAQRSATP